VAPAAPRIHDGSPADEIRDVAACASPHTGATDEARGSLADSLGQVERNVILDALRSGSSTRREIAERLGISPRTLRYKLARLRAAGIEVPAI
jgi:two-component system response regulator FlrC